MPVLSVKACWRRWIRWIRMDGTAERMCAKFTRKTCLVLHSDEFECPGQKSKVKVTRYKKRAVHLQLHPMQRYGRNGARSLQVTSRTQQTRRFDRCRGVSSPGCVSWAWRRRATARLCHAFLVCIYMLITPNFRSEIGEHSNYATDCRYRN